VIPADVLGADPSRGHTTTLEVGGRVAAPIPIALKVTHTAFVTALVPIYWRHYGPGNFLWFSDVALLLSVPALWFRSSFIASTQLVGVMVLETLWCVDFSTGVLARKTPIGLAAYMFDGRLPRFLRSLSLFHLWLTPVLLLVVSRTGYDRRALKYETVFTWTILLASWRLTRPQDNVNWVHSVRDDARTARGRASVVALLMLAIPLVFQLPAHLLLKRLFHPPAR